ncbi:sensor histidine kinase [Croceicoccus bisphenolivorans]|uniref:sensor histidine kinase n=1 Tax=Croceicoccus bisphenolivorans TaxID=1783232 RepID=UPI00082BE68F|nr:sensor histidine kinase [Croceicoccus bisphenolivorans]
MNAGWKVPDNQAIGANGGERLRMIRVVLLTIVIAIAASIAAIGWVLGYDPLVHVNGKAPAMVPTTAFCLLALTGAHLALHLRRSDASRAAMLCVAIGAGTIASVNLVAVVSGWWPHGIDGLLWPALFAGTRDAMAPATATCILLAVVASVELRRTGGPRKRLFQFAATSGLAVSAFALVAYLLARESLSNAMPFAAMSVQTAVASAMLFAAIVLAQPGGGWLSVLFGSLGGSRISRRLLPVVVLCPLGLAVLGNFATRIGWIDPGMRLVLLTVLLMAVGAAAVLLIAIGENRYEAAHLRNMLTLEKSSEEKERLLGEIYHRVRNNLQRIDAMLAFESAQVPGAEGRDAFVAMSHRVRALAVVHEALMRSVSLSRIEIADYLDRLSQEISRSRALPERGIHISCQVERMFVDFETANTMGLLVNELVSDAAVHAFPVGQQGIIRVSFGRLDADTCVLAVSDDGVNPAADLDRGGVGSRIIRSLARQLRGELRVEVHDGTHVTITFPDMTTRWDGSGANGSR